MKKRYLLFGLLAMLILSCASVRKAGTVYDESLPPEKSTLISTMYVGDIIGYNGISVNWKKDVKSMIQIPSGTAMLEWNVNAIGFTGKNLIMQFDFQPQKQYFFWVTEKNRAFGLEVYAYDFDEKTPYAPGAYDDKENHSVGFAPFLNIQRGINLN